ncbi:hypothetical protein PR048_031243 [Dryococelus australis]|uniref:Uncharacterized protein n=1 Tax=Dryococelus australis TaxID=614101 RepID=A0ABQ9G4Q7_9NEOP|nr:hypothetical protein PR048_031243 [Dryococelus australis]
MRGRARLGNCRHLRFCSVAVMCGALLKLGKECYMPSLEHVCVVLCCAFLIADMADAPWAFRDTINCFRYLDSCIDARHAEVAVRDVMTGDLLLLLLLLVLLLTPLERCLHAASAMPSGETYDSTEYRPSLDGSPTHQRAKDFSASHAKPIPVNWVVWLRPCTTEVPNCMKNDPYGRNSLRRINIYRLNCFLGGVLHSSRVTRGEAIECNGDGMQMREYLPLEQKKKKKKNPAPTSATFSRMRKSARDPALIHAKSINMFQVMLHIFDHGAGWPPHPFQPLENGLTGRGYGVTDSLIDPPTTSVLGLLSSPRSSSEADDLSDFLQLRMRRPIVYPYTHLSLSFIFGFTFVSRLPLHRLIPPRCGALSISLSLSLSFFATRTVYAATPPTLPPTHLTHSPWRPLIITPYRRAAAPRATALETRKAAGGWARTLIRKRERGSIHPPGRSRGRGVTKPGNCSPSSGVGYKFRWPAPTHRRAWRNPGLARKASPLRRHPSRPQDLLVLSSSAFCLPRGASAYVVRADEDEERYGPAPECKGGGKGIFPRKPADQRHHPARFRRSKVRGMAPPGIETGLICWEASVLTAAVSAPTCCKYGVHRESAYLKTYFVNSCGNVRAPTIEIRYRKLADKITPVSLLASHQGDPGSIPGRVTLDPHMWESCRTMPLVGGSSRDIPLPPSLYSGAAPYPPQSPSSALKTSTSRAVQISSPLSTTAPKRYPLHHDDSVTGSVNISVLKDCLFFRPSPHLPVENAEEKYASNDFRIAQDCRGTSIANQSDLRVPYTVKECVHFPSTLGSIPSGITPGFHRVGIVLGDTAGQRGCLGDLPFSPAPAFQRCSVYTSFRPSSAFKSPMCKGAAAAHFAWDLDIFFSRSRRIDTGDNNERVQPPPPPHQQPIVPTAQGAEPACNGCVVTVSCANEICCNSGTLSGATEAHILNYDSAVFCFPPFSLIIRDLQNFAILFVGKTKLRDVCMFFQLLSSAANLGGSQCWFPSEQNLLRRLLLQCWTLWPMFMSSGDIVRRRGELNHSLRKPSHCRVITERRQERFALPIYGALVGRNAPPPPPPRSQATNKRISRSVKPLLQAIMNHAAVTARIRITRLLSDKQHC